MDRGLQPAGVMMQEIMIIKTLIELVKNHGAAAALIAVASVLLLRACRALKATIDNLPREHRPDLHADTENALMVNRALDAIIRRARADRAYLCQYHNGGANFSGVPFTKLSRTHERCREGVSQQIHHWQAIPSALFAWLNAQLLSHRQVRLPDLSSLRSDDIGLYQALTDCGARSFYAVGIQNLSGRLIGFVAAEFTVQPVTLDDEDWDSIKAVGLKICGAVLMGGKKECDL